MNIPAISNATIHRRKFEGEGKETFDPLNCDALTSKWMTSYRYCVVFQQYGQRHTHCTRTKQEALAWVESASVAHEV